MNKENKDELTIETKRVALNNNDYQTLAQVLNLSKKYNRKSENVIDNLNFEIKSVEFHDFTGANGASKTTTIKVIFGAYANFEGQILIDGFDNHTALAKERIDYIPEKDVFPKNMNTFEYLVTMAVLSVIHKKEVIRLANEKNKRTKHVKFT